MLRFRRNGRYQRLDVTKREGESLVTVCVAFDLRYVVRHHHSVDADLLIHAHRFKHIDIAVIWIFRSPLPTPPPFVVTLPKVELVGSKFTAVVPGIPPLPSTPVW